VHFNSNGSHPAATAVAYLNARHRALSGRTSRANAANGVAMIPPQALHSVGLAMARAAGWGIARLTTSALDGTLDLEIKRLLRLDEPSLLIEIARTDGAGVAPTDLSPGQRAQLLQQGQATVDRVLPKARALVCPHRNALVKLIDSPEIVMVTTVAGYLVGGLPGALVKPIATLLVKRGIWLLCDEQRAK
jgi:hypothetical protein